MAAQLVFDRVPAQAKTRWQQSNPEVKMLYFGDLFEVEEDDQLITLSQGEQAVQRAMSAV
jgi:hypothetical protein